MFEDILKFNRTATMYRYKVKVREEWKLSLTNYQRKFFSQIIILAEGFSENFLRDIKDHKASPEIGYN